MLKHIYKGLAMTMLITLAACSTDTFTEEIPAAGDTPILLNGTATRAITDEKGALKALTGYKGTLKLSAKYNGSFYFYDKTLSIGTEVATQNKLTTDMCYPIGGKEIRLFAHTGEIKNSDNLTLQSGTASSNDILLSNGEDDNEGQGTPGSSTITNTPLLTFHHVMTKVSVVIDSSSDTELKDQPKNVKIAFGTNVPATGTFPITSPLSTTAAATNVKGSYSLVLGDNYLVPTGEALSGNIISALTIDDYKATKEDYQKLSISDLDKGGQLTLSPGLSYTLTLKISRLKVESITVSMSPWNPKDGNGDWGYTPYKIDLAFPSDGYDKNQITQVVLKHTTGSEIYQYVGGIGTDNKIDFVTLPASGTAADLTADLYTASGLLIAGLVPESYTAPNGSTDGTLSMNLGANGMNKDATGTYYEVTTPLQFYNLMTDPKENEKYRLKQHIDMSNLPLSFTPSTFPTGAELDGNGYQILHLNIKGDGLIAVNNGTLKNLHITTGSITATGNLAGGICGINAGTIEGCINEADITTTASATAGGICGKNTGKITACLNTGNIETGSTVGGICGTNENITANAITGCINAGMLNKKGADLKLGGICGSSADSNEQVINTCYWLTGTARKDQQISNEVAIGTGAAGVTQSADLAPDRLRTEAVTNINKVITGWEFKWEKDQSSTGTYLCVWPIPVKKTN